MRFSDYIEDRGISIAELAKRTKISRPTLYNIISGEDVRLSMAMKIEEFTEGKVTCYDLYEEYKKHMTKNAKKNKNNGK